MTLGLLRHTSLRACSPPAWPLASCDPLCFWCLLASRPSPSLSLGLLPPLLFLGRARLTPLGALWRISLWACSPHRPWPPSAQPPFGTCSPCCCRCLVLGLLAWGLPASWSLASTSLGALWRMSWWACSPHAIWLFWPQLSWAHLSSPLFLSVFRGLLALAGAGVREERTVQSRSACSRAGRSSGGERLWTGFVTQMSPPSSSNLHFQ